MAFAGLSEAYLGDWKCHYGDMMEVFVIRKATDGRVSVTVHDMEVGQGGQDAGVQDVAASSLTFRLPNDAEEGYHLEYFINWANEGGAVMNFEDLDANDGAYNSEWGWVVPATEDFKAH